MQNKGLKILVVVIACLGILSLIFLATSKKKPVPKINKQPVATSAKTVSTETPTAKSGNSQSATQAPTQNVKSEWEKCNNSTMAAQTKLLWKVRVTEAIPAGGTYAKGFLENDQALPVHVVIKGDSEITEKIKSMLVVGSDALLRGSCLQVANDESVTFEAF